MKPFIRCSVVLIAFIAATAVQGAQPVVDGFTFVKNVSGISEYRMPANDLGVLLLEDHSAPVLTFMVTYRVGSRDEVTGTTGATHLLEHLMFKGSKNFKPEDGRGFDTMMDRVGGINNATTWLDRTNYYENLPSDHLELAVQLEADRMRDLLLREEDRQLEMPVVRNEFERGENDPAAALSKEVSSAAIIAHPYHHDTIGWRSDIEKVSITKLREFYDTFYWPNNATVTVIGDFKSESTLQLIRQYFGKIPRSPKPIPSIYTEEPAQSGPRRVVVKRPGEVGVVEIAYKVPHARHVDHAPLEVLAALLSEGKTSRLYRALIDANLAISAEAAKGFFHDDTLFTLSSMLAPGTTHVQAEQALTAEIEKLKKEGVNAAEVERAINKLLATIAYQRDGSFAQAGQINEAIAVGDWTLYFSLLKLLKAVTPADVNRVARAYLNEDQSTTGWFIPQQAGRDKVGQTSQGGTPRSVIGGYARGPGSEDAAATVAGPYYYREPMVTSTEEAGADGGSGARGPFQRVATRSGAMSQKEGGNLSGAPKGAASALVAPKVQRRKIAGIDVLTLRTSIKDVVTLRGVLGAGDVFNPRDNQAIADLTAGMLDQGTVKRDKFAIAEALEQVGATLNFGTGTHTLNFNAKFLRKDLPIVVGLLGEQLRTPRFDAEELAKLKKQVSGRFLRAMEDTDFRAQRAFERAVFPEGHPNHPPSPEAYLAAIEATTLDQLKAFHAASYGPAAARIVAVGDVDDTALDQALRQAFDGWTGGEPIPTAKKTSPVSAGRLEKVNMPGKTSVSMVLGQSSGLRYADAEYQALNLGTAVLGSGFFSARLLDIIRNREGLTYGIGAGLSADTYADGTWAIRATFAPDLLDKGIASTLRELRRFTEQGLSAEELSNFKVTLTGSYKVALSTTDGLAATLLNAVQRGYGPEWVDEYPRRIEALSASEVNAAIKRILNPDRMITVLAGTIPGEAAK